MTSHHADESAETATSEGWLTGIAVRPARRAPMVEFDRADVTLDTGVYGDHGAGEAPAGAGFMAELMVARAPERAVTLLAMEAWQEALAAIPGCNDLPWTVRRANLLTKGLDLKLARESVITIGPVMLEVTRPTFPCKRMDEACPGLLKALAQDFRGGITCRVLEAGPVRKGDRVNVLHRVPLKRRRLP